MALKKSDLYSSLWASCDKLCGGEDLIPFDVIPCHPAGGLACRLTATSLQLMKTKRGGCNHRAGHIRLNTEMVKEPKDLLEYVIVHEMAHLLEPTHIERFVAILDKHFPTWREARAELNELPLAAENWK